MALITVLADDSAIATHVLPVVATEAAIEVVMPQIVGMGLPVHLHFGKLRVLEDLLQFGNGIADFEFLAFRNVGILALVEIINALRDALQGGVGGRISRG